MESNHNLNGMSQTKLQHGQFTLLGESEPQSHTLMAFPSIASVDTEEQLVASQNEVTRIANAIAEFEPVHLYAREELVDKARSMVKQNVTVKVGPVDQLWIRDSGPVYVRDENGQRTAMKFNFNYWGGKMTRTGDENLAAHIAKEANQECVSSRLVMEGGGIEHDGEGTFLATESCIINDNRNPGMTKSQIEDELRKVLGVTSFIWIPGIRGYDITDFHIDALARFTEPGTVLLSKPSANAPAVLTEAYKAALEILENSTDGRGRSLTVYECEEPDITTLGPSDQHNEVVASYCNYLLVNGAVIMPKFGNDRLDNEAFGLFKKLFPTRQVVQVEINMLPRTGGGIHCSTQHVPK